MKKGLCCFDARQFGNDLRLSKRTGDNLTRQLSDSVLNWLGEFARYV
jgi:hypothetical protein